jgi:hypothetical protein
MFPEETFGYLERHIGFAERNDFNDIIGHDLPAVEVKLDEHLVGYKKSDSYLHVQIRKTESLPTINQVDLRAELDVLLSEVSRVLQDI